MQKLVKGEFINNLEKVIDMLRDNEYVKNNIDMYVYQYNDDHDDERPQDIQQHECKTTGCILGHSLRLLDHDEFLKMNQKSKTYRISIYYQLVQEYFGIEHCGADWSFLFGNRWPNDASYCIKRIRFYLDNQVNMKLLQLSEDNERLFLLSWKYYD